MSGSSHSEASTSQCGSSHQDPPFLVQRIRELEESHAKLMAEISKLIRERDGVSEPALLRSQSMSPPPGKAKPWRTLSDRFSSPLDIDASTSQSSFSAGAADEGLHTRILESMGHAVYIFSPSAEVTYWNIMAERLYGWTSAEAVGRHILDLVVDGSSMDTATKIISRICLGEPWVGQFPLKKKSGEIFPAMITNTPLHDNEGRLVGIIGVSSDARPFMQSAATCKHSLEHPWQIPFASTLSNLASRILSNLRGSAEQPADYSVYARSFGMKPVSWISKTGLLWPWSGNDHENTRDTNVEQPAERIERMDSLTLPSIENKVSNSMSSTASMTTTASTSSSSHFGQSYDEGDAPDFEITWDSISLHDPIGQGSAATVHRGTWCGVDVAVKVFNEQYPDTVLQDFREEVAIMRNLRHPNILVFYGAVANPDHLCIVTELMHRGSLFRLLHKKTVVLDWRRKMQMVMDVVRGLSYLHNCKPPIVHRDLKSTNLLVDRNLRVKVGDFSLSRLKHSNFITANARMGTSQWMAPEVLRSEPSNERSDIYSFGVILWELATEQVPWKDLDPLQVVAAVGFMNRKLEIPENLDPRLAAIIQDCWKSNWQDRPSCDELNARLQEISRDL